MNKTESVEMYTRTFTMYTLIDCQCIDWYIGFPSVSFVELNYSQKHYTTSTHFLHHMWSSAFAWNSAVFPPLSMGNCMGKSNANDESRNQNFLTPPWKQFIFDMRWKQYVLKWAKSLTSNSDVTSDRKRKRERKSERK